MNTTLSEIETWFRYWFGENGRAKKRKPEEEYKEDEDWDDDLDEVGN